MKLHCFDCGKPFSEGDIVFEFTSGYFDGEMVIADDAIEQWCTDCEEKRGEM